MWMGRENNYDGWCGRATVSVVMGGNLAGEEIL